MRVAALDLGTNTFLCLIAEVSDGHIKNIIFDAAQVVRLGQEVHSTRRLHPSAIERADACLSEYGKVIRSFGVDRVIACATSAARDVKNPETLLQVGARHEIPIFVISGEREAELSFRGTVDAKDRRRTLVIDIGGGSTEFILGNGSGILDKRSLDVGSVRLTELFVTQHPISERELEKMKEYLNASLDEIKSWALENQPERVVAVAGTATTLATLDLGKAFASELVDGYRLKEKNISDWARKLSALPVSSRQQLPGMDAKRADVIPAGALILARSCQALNIESLEVSVRGLRFGIAQAWNEFA